MLPAGVIPRVLKGFAEVPADNTYVLLNCSVPSACLHNVDLSTLVVDHDGLVSCDIRVKDGLIVDVCSSRQWACSSVDLEGGCVWPTFVDLHTHIGTFLSPIGAPEHSGCGHSTRRDVHPAWKARAQQNDPRHGDKRPSEHADRELLSSRIYAKDARVYTANTHVSKQCAHTCSNRARRWRFRQDTPAVLLAQVHA